jgi:predicted nucleic acid-binding protein
MTISGLRAGCCGAGAGLWRGILRRLPDARLDVLHVAAARLLKTDTLATFDENQRTLAKSAGLKIVP